MAMKVRAVHKNHNPTMYIYHPVYLLSNLPLTIFLK